MQANNDESYHSDTDFEDSSVPRKSRKAPTLMDILCNDDESSQTALSPRGKPTLLSFKQMPLLRKTVTQP